MNKHNKNFGVYNGYIALTKEESIFLKNKFKKTKSNPKKKGSIQSKKSIDKKFNFDNSEPEMILTKLGMNIIPSYMENEIRRIINLYDIKYYTEVSFKGLKTGISDLSLLRFDFYIPSKRILIEYDGKDFHKEEDQRKRDKIKNLFCHHKNIKLIRLSSNDIPTLELQLLRILRN